MRITKKMLVKKNELLKTVIFVLLGIIFVLSITVSIQIPEFKNLLLKQSNGIKLTVSNTEKIIDIQSHSHIYEDI
jgi:predicted membrane channel-forming protein YqfA (hemolysin III family)